MRSRLAIPRCAARSAITSPHSAGPFCDSSLARGISRMSLRTRRYPTRWRRGPSPFSSWGQLLAASRGGGVSVLLLVALASACRPRPSAEVWVTTGDQHKLLSHEPDARFSNADTAGHPTIVVDEATTYQE